MFIGLSKYRIFFNLAVSKPKMLKIYDGKYELQDLIGQGTYGKVYTAFKGDSKDHVAVKIVDLGTFSEEDVKRVQREPEYHQNLRHKNIVSFMESFIEGKMLYIVMEYCKLGNLRQLIKSKKGLQEEECNNVLSQISQGLKYLHDQDICHRDVKTTNIFRQTGDIEYIVKLGDFGVARFMDRVTELSKYVGSPFFMSPEMISGKSYDKKTDVWSLGCVAYEMATTGVPYQANTKEELQQRIVRDDVSCIKLNYCPKMNNLILEMMSKEPDKRPDIQAVIDRLSQDEHNIQRADPDNATGARPKGQSKKKDKFSLTWSPGSHTQLEADSGFGTADDTPASSKKGDIVVQLPVRMSEEEKHLVEEIATKEKYICQKLKEKGMNTDEVMKEISDTIDKTKHMDNNTIFMVHMEKLLPKSVFVKCKYDLHALWFCKREILSKPFYAALNFTAD